MNYLCFTTCDCQSGRAAEYERLLKSIRDNVEGTDLKVTHVVLFQRAGPDASDAFFVESREGASVDRHFLHIDDLISLSAARNLMLDYASGRGLVEQADIICFPDDDAWYPDGLLEIVAKHFESDNKLAVLASDYGEDPVKAQYDAFCSTASLVRASVYMSSNTIFVSKLAASKAGLHFDERLGLGARYNGGEDLDFGMRALLLSNGKLVLCKDQLVGHRNRQPWVKIKYYIGSLAAISRASRYSARGAALLARKVSVGLWWVLTGKMKWAGFAEALLSAGEFMASHRNVMHSIKKNPARLVRVGRGDETL